ncbi:Mov34/MPN/PAD-1 family protein [Tissierella sp.]|uniref:Mov34/MPN/PAD-1 family protein n=1 Tax=Tissierella sp. TaxID=41274 RepID=UPI00285A68CF|nr:Mov34/MPN/PAD-1 family protein [Tissierella sp.]MDR7855520.1 Mov34/MPN/PAD-1 family protein [Tissierella sp.]
MKMSDLFFQDKNQLYSINLNKIAYEKMLKYCTKSNPYETGGILLGNYSADQSTANILQATPPPKNSKHLKCNFCRGTDGLQKVLDSAWIQGQYYIGEWHYHPNSLPIPSSTDINQMISLANDKKLMCPEPILIIIGERNLNWSVHASIFTNCGYTILHRK